MCEMFEADQGNILQKAAIDAEAERGKKRFLDNRICFVQLFHLASQPPPPLH